MKCGKPCGGGGGSGAAVGGDGGSGDALFSANLLFLPIPSSFLSFFSVPSLGLLGFAPTENPLVTSGEDKRKTSIVFCQRRVSREFVVVVISSSTLLLSLVKLGEALPRSVDWMVGRRSVFMATRN